MIIERKIEAPLPDLEISLGSLSPLMQAIGTPGFVNALLDFGYGLAGAEFVSVFCLGDHDEPLLVGTASRLGQHRADRAAKGYTRHMASDRNSALLTGEAGVADFITIQQAENLESFTYRRDCYDLPGISGRVSFIRRTASYGLSVSLYSSRESGPFDNAARQIVQSILPMLLTAAERHVAFTLKGQVWQGQDIQARLALSFPDLTKREREVAAMAIKGRTASESAAILGLSETTIITHRKKAYKRMNVKSLRQLVSQI